MRSAGPPPSRALTLPGPSARAVPIRRSAARSTVAVLGVWLFWPGAFGYSEGPTATELRFDRPFLVVIRERLSGTIIFMGVIHDPTA